MDFRIIDLSRLRRFPSPQAGLRAVAKQAPRAEAMAASFIQLGLPLGSRIYSLRRRIATVTVLVLAALLFIHVMFGANGMVVYKQKRADYQSLQKRITLEQKENDIYTQQIRALKTDEKAIEKEAREQLRYVRPGEYVYVPPVSSTLSPTTHSAKR